MVKVLHFVSTPAIWNGVMSVIMNYYRHIDKERVQFDFLCFMRCEQSYEAEIKKLGGRVFYIPKPGSSIDSLFKLRNFFETHRDEYQIVHNHEVYLSFYLEPLTRHVGISRFIVHSHATRYSDRPASAVRNAVLCLPIRFMKCEMLACSREAGVFLFGNKKIEKGPFCVLHNAIAIDHFSYDCCERTRLRKRLNIENCFVIGHVGRYMPQKNHDFLMKMFANLHIDMPNARLLLVGDGPCKARIEKQCEKYGIMEKVIFVGNVYDVQKWYSAMDILVLPSIFEGLGNALIEAQANGLTCLASEYVPIEAKIADSCSFLPLKENEWMQAILDFEKSNPKRKEVKKKKITESFLTAHYDINVESQWLQSYYENTNSYVHI